MTSWNFSTLQSEALAFLFESVLAEAGYGALVLADGKALHVRPRTPADIATLPAATMQCHQYLQLKDGEIAISNDPYAGGTKLSDVTLVLGVAFESQGAADLLMAIRLALPHAAPLTGKIDDEGVRIPPMPLVSQGKMNAEILAAIASHPLARPGFEAAVRKGVADLQRAHGVLRAIARDPKSDWRKANLKRFFQDSADALKGLVSKLPLGEALVTASLEDSETIKLRLEVADDKVLFDFSGTEASPRLQLTDLGAFGACFAALGSVLHQPIPANAGTFQRVEVHSPAQTLVNSKAPAGTALGMTDGISTLCELVVKAFAKLNAQSKTGASPLSTGQYELVFSDGRRFSDVVPGGTGAGKDRAGLPGWNRWLSEQPSLQSIEELERAYPILFKAISTRPGSAGKGKWTGGEGIAKSFVLRAPAKLRWNWEDSSHKPEGIESGKAAQAAELMVTRASGEKIKLGSSGETDLAPGDLVRFMSAGGGGYGDPD